MYRLLFLYIILLGIGTSLNFPLLGKQIQIADIFFILILLGLILNIKKYLQIALLNSLPTIKYIFIILLLFLLVAAGYSIDTIKSLMEFAAIIYLVILYLWIGSIRLNQRQFNSLIHIWLYLSGCLCILALGGFLSYAIFGKKNLFIQFYPTMKSVIPFARVAATFPTMNMFASFLHVSIIFLLTVIAYGRWHLRYILLAGLILICLFLTSSRNLLGIFITTFLVLIPIKNRPTLSMLKYIAFGLSILLFFLVLITTVWCIFPTQINYDNKNHIFSLSVNTAPSLYMILNKMSVRFIKQSPLVGIGPGMFNRKFTQQLNWNEVKDTFEAKGIVNRGESIDPHNTYLGWTAEAGIPFVVVMIGMFYCIVYFMWRGYKSCINSFMGFFCYACMCGVIGFMVNGFYVDILTMRHFWVMMGLGTIGANLCLKMRI